MKAAFAYYPRRAATLPCRNILLRKLPVILLSVGSRHDSSESLYGALRRFMEGLVFDFFILRQNDWLLALMQAEQSLITPIHNTSCLTAPIGIWSEK